MPERNQQRPRSGAQRGRGGAQQRGQRRRTRKNDRSSTAAEAQRPQRGQATRTDPARTAAYLTLRRVGDSDAYANLVLPPLLRERGISGRDAAFATELTYGTLRLQGRYDAIVDLVSNRPSADLDAPVRDVLRLGAHQLLGMRVAGHAAVSESVALARQQIGPGPANFVNAVLRRISEQTLPHWLAQLGEPEQGAADVETLARVHSHPAWVVRAIRQGLGPRADHELVQALVANNEAPAVTLALRPGLASDADAADAYHGRWAPTARVLDSGDPGTLPAVRTGAVGVQDEGSQLVTLAFAGEPLDGTDDTWLDLCAGPGGKAALLAALLAERNPDATLVANEISEHRTELVRNSLQALTPRLAGLEVRTSDGAQIGHREPGRYDRVLLDAPCTGLGALRRRPESRWRRTLADLAALTELQRSLLRSALQATRPGGLVGYVTCSPHLAETDLVVTDVLREFPGAHLLDAAQAVDRVAVQALPELSGPTVQLWPHRHGTDAMFLALIAVPTD